MSETTTTPERGGLADLLRSAARAALVVGAVFGLLDGVVAASVGTARLGPLDLAGCLAGAVFQYVLLALAGLSAAALLAAPWLRRRPRGDAARALLALGLAVGIFAEAYWWTREQVFYGRPATSPERLAAAGAFALAALVLGWLLARAVARLAGGAQRAVAASAAVLALAGAAYLTVRGPGASPRGAIDERNRDLPNVVLVIVDALRADVLGCYGAQGAHTPAIDGLAARGVVFENAYVQAPFTWTSFGSFLTGKYPRRHGLVKMTPGVAMARDHNVTLPWHLKRAKRLDGGALDEGSYLGATFHTGTLSTGSGLLRGFDVYLEAMAGHDLVALENPWSVFRSDLLLHVFRYKLEQRFHDNLLAVRARDWIGENADRRFCAMVHLYSTHTPYDPPARYREPFVDPAYDGPIGAFYAQGREAIERGEYVPTAADVAQIRALYRAGVAQADAEIGAIVAELERAGILDDTLVIVTADHGESLGEPYAGVPLWEHNHMVQTNLRVPLVMSWPGRLAQGVRVPALVDSIDLVPTVCDLARIEVPHEEREDRLGVVDGASLLPLVRGEASSVREFSFAENGLQLSAHDLARKLIVAREVVAVDPPEEGWRRALAGELPRPRYHDLRADPGEQVDALDANLADAKQLWDALIAWDRAMPRPVTDVVLSARDREATERALEAFGYTESGVGADVAPHGPPANGGSAPPAPPANGPSHGTAKPE